eukprot:CAMPEP_0196666854 /NCGR_PEP_ID=MMETSP1086-20130531/64749_1 /TAXON_ID=77921 /ORGANISM="Cyanoptyche  gloeocystis , Strain SAG4.97" /LENGTH=564 /DNA_ID=CAMNT_0042004103 /DNA_START=1 /DNA_END=1697 /DNA_ORIENTATION=-
MSKHTQLVIYSAVFKYVEQRKKKRAEQKTAVITSLSFDYSTEMFVQIPSSFQKPNNEISFAKKSGVDSPSSLNEASRACSSPAFVPCKYEKDKEMDGLAIFTEGVLSECEKAMEDMDAPKKGVDSPSSLNEASRACSSPAFVPCKYEKDKEMDGLAIFTEGVLSECEKAMEDMDAPSGPGRECTSPNVTQLTDCLGRYCRRHVVADCTCESLNRKRRFTADVASDDDGIELDEAPRARNVEAHWAIRSFSRTWSSPDIPAGLRSSKRHMNQSSGSGYFQRKPWLGLCQSGDVRKSNDDFREDTSSLRRMHKCARAQVVPESEDSTRSSSTVLSELMHPEDGTDVDHHDFVNVDMNRAQEPQAPHRSSIPVPSCGRMPTCEDVDVGSSRPLESSSDFEVLKPPMSSPQTKTDRSMSFTHSSTAPTRQWPAFKRPPADAQSESSQESTPFVTQARLSFRMPSLYSDASGILTRPSPSSSPSGVDAAAASTACQFHPPTFRAEWFRPIDAILSSTPEDAAVIFGKASDEPTDVSASSSSRYRRWDFCGARGAQVEEEPIKGVVRTQV